VKIHMSKAIILIEPRTAGGFAAKLEGGKRPVVIGDTQLEVIRETKAARNGPRCSRPDGRPGAGSFP
jgi:hypothetical protein